MDVVEEIVDETVTQEENQVEQVLANFDWANYVQYFPASVASELQEMLSTHAYGWKSKARMLLRIERISKELQTAQVDLANSFVDGRHAKTPEEKAHGAMKRFLATLTESKLQEACVRYNISYNTFMSSNDKAGLIEALAQTIVGQV